MNMNAKFGAKIDPVLLSVYARTFKSITDEMSISMAQTTRSPILCEAKDYVTGLYDGDGNMLEQTENLPILAFSLAPVCKYIKQYFGDEIYPGDVIFHNDVFSLGNQNNDVAAFKPVFADGRLVAWTAVKGHQADIGGEGGRKGQAAPRRVEPDIRQCQAGYRAARHEGRDGNLHRGRAPPARAAGKVRHRQLRSAQAGAVRCHAQNDGSGNRQDSERQVRRGRLRPLRRPQRRLEVHHPRGYRSPGQVDQVRLLAHRRPDQRLRQRHLHFQRFCHHPYPAANGESGHSPQ